MFVAWKWRDAWVKCCLFTRKKTAFHSGVSLHFRATNKRYGFIKFFTIFCFLQYHLDVLKIYFPFPFIFFNKLQLVCRSTDTAVSEVRCVLKKYKKQMSSLGNSFCVPNRSGVLLNVIFVYLLMNSVCQVVMLRPHIKLYDFYWFLKILRKKYTCESNTISRN